MNIRKASMFSQEWHHRNCYGCGPENDKGFHANFPFDEEHGEVRFTYKFSKSFEGAPGFVHGGAIATILDEAQGVLCYHLGHFVLTDNLSLKYLKTIPIETEIDVRVIITAVRKRRLYTKAFVSNIVTGEIYTISNAKWFAIKERTIRKMFQNAPQSIENLLYMLEENKKRAKEIRKRLKSKMAVLL